MRSLTFLFVTISTIGLSQFSPIWVIPSNFSGFDIKGIDINNTGKVALITDQYNGGPFNDIMTYYSVDYGLTWDSTFFTNQFMIRNNVKVTESGNVYFSTIVNVPSTTNPPGYQMKVVNSLINNSSTWVSIVVDSLNGALKECSLHFLNDSTGMFFYQKGEYLTQDYGQTWQKVYGLNAEHLGVLNDRFILYTYQDILTINPLTNAIDSMQYLPYAEGNVDQSCFKNGVAYRMIFDQDGQQQGYSTSPSNYASLNIDTLPLGNQTVIHFPQRVALLDIEVTESRIHLVLDGRYARSCDGGHTFYDVDAFNGNMNEQVMFIDFVNDTLGFAVTQNLITFEWRLWKTTNGGGTNLAPILTNSFIGGLSVSELQMAPNFAVFPNPTHGQFQIQSDNTIDRVEIYTTIGEQIESRIVEKNEKMIDLSHLESGIYFVRAFSDNSYSDRRLILAK